MFDKNKENTLSKLDKSKKGEIDTAIIPLMNRINSLPNYYTTSTCSGRIALIELGERKNENNWLLCTHSPTTLDELQEALKKATNETWFKMEPLILHICCRTIDDADQLLKIARSIGIKRGGIFSVEPKIVVELQSTEQIELLIADNQIRINKDYIPILIESANTKLQKTKEKIKKLQRLLE